MKITLSKYAGFCGGVDRAYKIVEEISRSRKIKKPVFVLGSLVHNEDVTARIEKMGIKKIDGYYTAEGKFSFPKIRIGTIIITAHGSGPEVYEFFKKKKIDIIDTTCPKVIKVQRLAKIFSEKKYQIVIIGEKSHKEVKGICDWADKQAIIIENEDDLNNLSLDPKKNIAVISQTTQNQDFVRSSAGYIAKKYPNVEIVDSICEATRGRQTEAKSLAEKNDAMIIIGSLKSANSTRLWEIAKNINKNSHFITRASDLKKSWFAGCKKTAVTAGASTPGWVIEGVIAKLRSMNHEAGITVLN